MPVPGQPEVAPATPASRTLLARAVSEEDPGPAASCPALGKFIATNVVQDEGPLLAI